MSKRKQKLDARTSEFLQAVTRGDIEVASAALNSGVDPNARDADGFPAIILATMEEFAYAGLDNPPFIDPNKPYVKLVKLLLHHGADVNQTTKDGDAALTSAIINRSGEPELTRVLLEAGADPNHRDCDGETPLHDAVRYESADITRLLLEHGADVRIATKKGETPFHWTLKQRGHPCHDLLRTETLRQSAGSTVAPIDPSALNELLVKAVEAGSARVAAACLDEGADINTQDAYKNPLLHSAAFDGHDSVVALLLARGVPVDLASTKHDGDTPLIWAAEAGHVSTVRLLLSKGANPNVYGTDDYGPLHRAASNNYVDVAVALCDAGAEISSNTEIGTPLHVACRKGHIDMAQFLLERGADPFIRDIDDRTPREWCKSHHRLTELLKRAEDARGHGAGHKPPQRPK